MILTVPTLQDFQQILSTIDEQAGRLEAQTLLQQERDNEAAKEASQ